jgi:hypothetical protein
LNGVNTNLYKAFFQGHKATLSSRIVAETQEHRFIVEELGEKYSQEYWAVAVAKGIVDLVDDNIHKRVAIYNWTHAVFFATRFGEEPLEVQVTQPSRVVGKALVASLSNLQEWDLLLEVLLALSYLGENIECMTTMDITLPLRLNVGIVSEGVGFGGDHKSIGYRYSCFHTTCIFLMLVNRIRNRDAKTE